MTKVIDEKEFNRLVDEGIIEYIPEEIDDPPDSNIDDLKIVADTLEKLIAALLSSADILKNSEINQILRDLVAAQKVNDKNLQKILKILADRKPFWKKVRFEVQRDQNGQISSIDAKIIE